MTGANQQIVVTIKADTSEFDAAVEEVRRSLVDLTYVMDTVRAAHARLGRALWPHLPLWKRVWLTLQRKGW